jgi:hypothetical protein
LFKALLKSFGWRFAAAGLLKIGNDIGIFAGKKSSISLNETITIIISSQHDQFHSNSDSDSLLFYYTGPFFLQKVIQFVDNKGEEPLWVGIMYAFGILCGAFVVSLFLNAYFLRVYRVGMNVRKILILLEQN